MFLYWGYISTYTIVLLFYFLIYYKRKTDTLKMEQIVWYQKVSFSLQGVEIIINIIMHLARSECIHSSMYILSVFNQTLSNKNVAIFYLKMLHCIHTAKSYCHKYTLQIPSLKHSLQNNTANILKHRKYSCFVAFHLYNVGAGLRKERRFYCK